MPRPPQLVRTPSIFGFRGHATILSAVFRPRSILHDLYASIYLAAACRSYVCVRLVVSPQFFPGLLAPLMPMRRLAVMALFTMDESNALSIPLTVGSAQAARVNGWACTPSLFSYPTVSNGVSRDLTFREASQPVVDVSYPGGVSV